MKTSDKPASELTPEQLERRRTNQKKWYEKRKERISTQRKERRAKKSVRGTCPVCSVAGVKLVRDHCHKKGHTRGYICNHCNLALGHAKDQTRILVRLIDYLESTKNARDGSNKTGESD